MTLPILERRVNRKSEKREGKPVKSEKSETETERRAQRSWRHGEERRDVGDGEERVVITGSEERALTRFPSDGNQENPPFFWLLG